MLRQRLPYGLILLSLVLAGMLAAALGIQRPAQLITREGEAALTFEIGRQVVLRPTSCVYATWQVENVRGIFVNGRATVGTAAEFVCLDGSPAVTWRVILMDDTTRTLTLPVMVLATNPAALLTAGAALLSGLAGALWLATRWARQTDLRGTLAAAGTVALGLAVTLGALEVGFRGWLWLAGTEDQRVRYLYTADEIDRATILYTGLPYFNFGLNPASDEVNVRGIRGELAAIPKPDGVYRIVAVGGSTTFGEGVSVDAAYPARLEALLNGDYGYTGVEVVNLGVPAFNTLDTVVNVAVRALDYEPDLLIVYHGVNDAILRATTSADCFAGDNPLRGMGGNPGIWQYSREPLPRSTLYRWVALRIGLMNSPAALLDRLEPTDLCDPAIQGRIADLITTNTAANFERNLRTIIGVASVHNMPLILPTFAWDDAATLSAAIPPGATLGEVSDGVKTALREHNTIIQTLGAAYDDVYVPAFAEALPDDAALWQPDGYHLTADGIEMQVRVLADAIDEAGLIPR